MSCASSLFSSSSAGQPFSDIATMFERHQAQTTGSPANGLANSLGRQRRDEARDLFLGACAADDHVDHRVRIAHRAPELLGAGCTASTENGVVRRRRLAAGAAEGGLVTR